MNLGRLGHDGADTLGFNDTPDEKCDSCSGCNNGLECKEVSYLVYGEPDGWQGYEPEQKETHEVFGSRSGRSRKMVRYIVNTRPHRP